jgi:hypothetical protein
MGSADLAAGRLAGGKISTLRLQKGRNLPRLGSDFREAGIFLLISPSVLIRTARKLRFLAGMVSYFIK